MATAEGQTARLTYEWRRSDHTVISGGAVDKAVVTTGFLRTILVVAAPTGAKYLYLALQSTAAGSFVVFDDIAPNWSTISDYDGGGLRTSVMDANGRVTRFGYDAAGRLISTTDGRGKTTAFEVDANGNRTRATDPLGHLTDYLYDAANRETRRTADPGGLALVWQQSYDAVGNVLTATDPDSRTTTYAYDQADRISVQSTFELAVRSTPAGTVTLMLPMLTGATPAEEKRTGPSASSAVPLVAVK